MLSLCQYWKKHSLTILGLILMAVATIYAVLAYHFPLKQTTETKTTEEHGNNKETDKTNIAHNSPPVIVQDTPEKIMAEIEAAPPIQQADIAKTYSGIPVDWILFYRLGSSYNDGYSLLLASSLDISKKVSIKCFVPKSNNDFLRRLQKNAKVRVRGTIDKIDPLAIYIMNAALTLP